MTLEEKAAQMLCVWQEKPQKLVNEKGEFDEAKAKRAFRDRRGLRSAVPPTPAAAATPARWPS
jgi:beta-glucosidase